MKILFLYSEIADYLLACVKTLVRDYPVEVRIIKWKVNEEAPFKFQYDNRIQVNNKEEYPGEKLQREVDAFRPDLLFTAGWMDKDYLQIARSFRKRIPVVAGLDNPWKGNLRQRIAGMLSPFYLRSVFTHVWCAGIRQYEFARRLGFHPREILMGLYSANVELFRTSTPRTYRKEILYAGRFLDWKGVRELYNAFVKIQATQSTDWRLRLIGRGPLRSSLETRPDILIEDFLQPEQLAAVVRQTGVYCLPSWEEHWGVVIHEATTAARPVIVSDGVGAGTAFVRNGYNGFVFPGHDEVQLAKVLEEVTSLPPETLEVMGTRSEELSRQISPESWAATLMSVFS